MSGKMIALVLAGVVVIAGGAYFFTKSSSPSGTPTSAQEGGMFDAKGVNAGKGSFASLLSMGDVKCEVHSEVGASSKGIVYVSGGKMRADFTSSTQAGTFNSSMINDGAYLYTWTDAVPQGMKLPAQDVSAQQATAGTPTPGFDYAAQVDYSCAAWSVDASLFAPPANVNFITPPSL